MAVFTVSPPKAVYEKSQRPIILASKRINVVWIVYLRRLLNPSLVNGIDVLHYRNMDNSK